MSTQSAATVYGNIPFDEDFEISPEQMTTLRESTAERIARINHEMLRDYGYPHCPHCGCETPRQLTGHNPYCGLCSRRMARNSHIRMPRVWLYC